MHTVDLYGNYPDYLTSALSLPIIQSVGRESGNGEESTRKSASRGTAVIELMDMFPTEAATEWFETVVLGERRGKCGSVRTREVPNATPMPYWCTDCRSYFSVRTGTPIARSNVPMRKWAIGSTCA